MNTIDQARAFMTKAKDMTREALGEATKALSEDVRNAYWELRKASYFVPENEKVGSRKEHLSPSGKYKLVVGYFETGPGTWAYSQGTIYRLGSDVPIAIIQRDYGAFPFLWVEGHQNGHAYLIGGATYQGQTVIELDTGTRKDSLPKEAGQGFGFCWSSYRYHAESGILIVDGCFWACPYEFRFYDFSDPIGQGWPEIANETGSDADKQWPKIEGNTIKCFDTSEYDYADDEEEDEDDGKLGETKSIKTFRRKGLKLVLVEEWTSEKEKEERKNREESNRRYEEWLHTFRTTDELYLAYKKLLAASGLDFESGLGEGLGYTYEAWCPHWKGSESRMTRRILQGDKSRHVSKPKNGQRYTIDLEWAVKTGPIKLQMYLDGNTHEDKWFEHSVEGMQQAFAYAKELAARGLS